MGGVAVPIPVPLPVPILAPVPITGAVPRLDPDPGGVLLNPAAVPVPSAVARWYLGARGLGDVAGEGEFMLRYFAEVRPWGDGGGEGEGEGDRAGVRERGEVGVWGVWGWEGMCCCCCCCGWCCW
jgi:hypothetical protein